MAGPAAGAAGLTLLASVVLGVGCGGADVGSSSARPTATATAEPDPTTTAADPQGGSLADAIRPLPPAPTSPTEAPALPSPAILDVAALDVAGAPIVPVGVEPDGEMEIPGVAEVGWYRHGPHPGDGGSSVLAAHIAYDGVDGVFRHLDDLRTGDDVVVGFADGATRRFAVDAVTRYPKSELPADVFADRGAARLVLITCGGRFDTASGHYEDNVVVHARPA
jgi:LPXTG-site transpeptidase (sortase) family protein